MKSSRLKGFYAKSVQQRHNQLITEGFISDGDVAKLLNGGLTIDEADKITENVVGIYSLPFSIAANFKINGKDRLVAMSIEEPSVVAAASNAARIVRQSGGFSAQVISHLMTAQIQLLEIKNIEQTIQKIAKHSDEILEVARQNSCNIENFGGGVKELETRRIKTGNEERIILHIYVDCADAMGANTVNTIAEKTAPFIEKITGAKTGLRILSNLAHRRICKAMCTIHPAVLLEYKGAKELKVENKAEAIRDGVISAWEFAEHDPYRAATHNKGIMNGIDAVAIATGNDWRAIEAGAHSYAAKAGGYHPLSKWYKDEDGNLIGKLEMPMAVGIVGGMTKFHKCSEIALRIMEIKSVRELEMVMVCVGLANNLAALLALSTEGIQRGHMRLHERHIKKQ